MAGIVLSDAPTSSRIHRRPRHKFYTQCMPYGIYPFAVAPVWPGESLVNAWFETREVSAPIVDSITGWGSEWYLFYCKLSDLIAYPAVMSMLIDPTNAPLTGSNFEYADNPWYYHRGPYPNYGFMCTNRIVETYFRDVGEAPDDGPESVVNLNGIYKAKFRDHALFDSITPGAFDDSAAVPPAASGMDDLARAADLYDYLVAAKLTDLSYSDWCAAYGVKIPAAEKNEPELLFKFTEWVYPSNTIDPVSGEPSSAVSLVVKKSFNQPLYFKEPGFVIGLHVVRPKLYLANQRGNHASLLNTALAWLPAMLSSDPSTSLREFNASDLLAAPAVPTDKYIVDMRDVPLYGDQLVTAVSPSIANFAEVGEMAYPTNAAIAALFTGADNTFKSDGFLNLDIVGRIVDYTTAGTATI